MGEWSLEFLPAAEDDLAALDSGIRGRIIDKLDWFVSNFNETLPATLGGEFREFYKLRVGDWRIKYKVNRRSNIIIVCYIDRRDKAYKKR